jgi:DNA polymerase/3'-5' exonuclease PolX
MSGKKRYPRAEALAVAEELVARLDPVCQRIQIAGSLRRELPDVGDIELLFVPMLGTRQRDLFTTETYDLADEKINELLKAEIIAKRPNKNGAFAWGEKNKLGIHCASGIPVDFFSTDSECWWNSLVVRTGGKENNLLITTTAQKKGYSFEAYGNGYRSLNGLHHHQTTSEREVFGFIGLPYLEPKDRK